MAKKTVNDKDSKSAAQKKADLDLKEQASAISDQASGEEGDGDQDRGEKPNPEKEPEKTKGDGRSVVHFVSRYKKYRVPGASFDNFRFSTDDPALIAKLKAHGAYGNEFRIEVPGI